MNGTSVKDDGVTSFTQLTKKDSSPIIKLNEINYDETKGETLENTPIEATARNFISN